MEHEHHKNHKHHDMDEKLLEVQVNTTYNSGIVTIKVRDKENNAVALTETHEKRMHLVITSAGLETFLHVHPIENASGDFEVEVELPPGRYLAFADITPVGMTYVIEPITITVGKVTETPSIDWEMLAERDSATKKVEGKTVTFHHPKLTAGKSAALSFDLNGETPLPYLGALGHVVVLDEQGEKFIHVHPVSEDKPVFEAQFPSPGFYKLWVEFKFSDAGVLAFPFVMKVADRN
ncbi:MULTISPECIES: hypothetical protein [unclassified Planococcus (in: firmicutes)]|uniref:hypothetical protein n=1 Tax=unclassified Planococcus (in: firmicutes) TaxID=2662419 RepID=UPI000C34D0B6|nr:MULTISPECIES: hypothetical protein [unclassified Planococcus (in: firmicutes)]AUD14928.1 hypothetical protein CW734_16200 [Planococcus sp. MB-3u-03]PKG45253.1 hypothetical protein CXF66_15740 [Planococcus sp. Urea-trap-24]PKG87595.1 hypothetical protein CXF91_16590 [Planococcus sp. Urea-3u-39]PKH41586.1 hypothetical protein CXF77_06110 [Planococcus sp. MB-3u-09]